MMMALSMTGATTTTTMRVAFSGRGRVDGGVRATTTTTTTTTTRRRRRGGAVTTEAFFNFGGAKSGGGGAAVDTTPYLCIDCGYVYRGGDFKKLPNSYRCPTCNVGKNRFKAQGGASVLAQKKANKEAFRAKREAAAKGGKSAMSPREKLKQQMLDAQQEKDKKRGWF
jgi:rubredoxin